ncbi:hypothetical protein CPAR01_09639 [Colletotrichum paranaense]|uniref:2EXR domain-containing protein n=1 Tax=Colletotrichum paranaense TaxID=1914294 RepID=A0ABQ9SHM5_9PEZI|nr:uncharacterized protein CPAR01_09639 [Colletotrichum paranaense]KAK1536097.1 hypothetical protein CPAR01_09639 [Colletotrichum paranaense]
MAPQHSRMDFPQFQKLPAEIKRRIWIEALPAPRIYEPDNRGPWISFNHPTRFYREYYPPRVRETCKDAYDACMSVGHFTFGYFDNSNIRGLWYNKTQDAVYYATCDQWFNTPLKGLRKIYVSMEVAISIFFDQGLRTQTFEDCRHLVVALYLDKRREIGDVITDDFATTAPVFRAMRDEDIMVAKVDLTYYLAGRFPELLEKEFLTWADFKSVLLQKREEIILENSNEPWNAWMKKGPLLLEAVEVFRKPDVGMDPERLV